MRPYYDADGITIYHGDCRELLPGLAADAIVADPPYGNAYNPSHRKYQGRTTGLAPVVGDGKPFDPAPFLATDLPMVLWGANHYANRLPPSSSWLVWDKVTRNGLDLRISECELAWTNCIQRPRIFRHLWSGGYRASEQGHFVHPTQKPVVLMRWVLGLMSKPGDLILDPYMGSGPVLRAAKDLGRRAIGIEIEERYCEIAAKRLGQGVLPLLTC
jgi:DNA modification methylase